MITTTLTRARTGPSRRLLDRRGKRVLLRTLAKRRRGARRALEPAVRRFLAPLSRRALSSPVGDRRVAVAAAALLLATGAAVAEPPVELADVAAGIGGFVINGIEPNDELGRSVSSAGDVNGDGVPDLIVGAWGADPGGVDRAGESYAVFGPARAPCPADFDSSSDVGFGDLIRWLPSWGPCAACPQDLDGDGVVGFSDLLILLVSWGPCP